MMHSDLRPLPHFHLPVAFLRWWPAAGGPNLGARLESLGSIPSLERLDESLLAIVPRNGRAALFDTALQVAWALLGDHSEPRSDLPGVLLFPGRVLDTGDELRPIEDPFFQDLEQRAPTLAPGIPVVTGYGASWLRGHYELTDAGSYEAESGRRVPLFRVVQKRHQLLPWHNPELLGRRVRIPRSVDATLDQTLSLPVVLATGPLGVGKGFSIWHRLLNKPGPQIWVDFAATLPDRPVLTQELLRRLPASADLAASADGPLTDDPEDEAQRLVSHLTSAKEAVGERLWLVCDATQAASGFDLELLGHMLREPRLLQSCRLIVIEREGRAHPSFQDLPRVRIPAMSSSEAGRLAERLFEGLEIHPPVQERLLEAAAGYPFALEEGLTRLVHRGLMRRIYGSFFFAGGEDTAYEPSERLIRHVEAEVRRLGEPLPLRLLAAAGEPISAAQLRGASAHFGIDLPTEWARPWMDAGWIRFTEDAQNNLAFACPAFGAALLRTLAPDGEQSLRHALGGVLADSGQNSSWRAYRLLAGSPEALPSLLDFNRDSGIGVPREEVYNALWSEYRDHRARRADEATELEILWSLLPLARRLGCLSQLETELRRAVELAEGQDQRYVALVALKAELDQEMGRFYEAEHGLRLALASSEGFDEKRRATLFLRLGAMLHREERWNEARRIFRQLLSVVEEGSSLAAMCNFYLGNIALQERQLDEAESLHRLALDVRHGKGLAAPEGASLCALGAVAHARGDYPTALDRFRQAEGVLTRAEADPTNLAFALLGRARALARLGDPITAGKAVRSCLESRAGRDDKVGEAIARMELASNLITREQLQPALAEARRAHFHLSLVPSSSLLGDAERLLGRILIRQRDYPQALQHLEAAMRIHQDHKDGQAIAEDRSWLMELARIQGDWQSLHQHFADLWDQLQTLPFVVDGEALYFRLFRASEALLSQSFEVSEAVPFLRRAYKELMRKTSYLDPSLRHQFLYQIVEHQAVLDAAAQHQLSLPLFTGDSPP